MTRHPSTLSVSLFASAITWSSLPVDACSTEVQYNVTGLSGDWPLNTAIIDPLQEYGHHLSIVSTIYAEDADHTVQASLSCAAENECKAKFYVVAYGGLGNDGEAINLDKCDLDGPRDEDCAWRTFDLRCDEKYVFQFLDDTICKAMVDEAGNVLESEEGIWSCSNDDDVPGSSEELDGKLRKL